MSGIFISYRRGDSKKDTDRISDWLIRKFGARAIFQDVDSIPAGVDFRTHVRSVISRADIQMIVIGPHWLSMTEETGTRRLDAPNDPVRIEIEAALAADIPMIPLLVSGAEMPSETQLPESIARLANVNAITVRDNPDFSSDIQKVIQAIRRQRFTLTRRASSTGRRYVVKHRRKLTVAGSAGVLLALMIAALVTAQVAGIRWALFAKPTPRATATATRIPAPGSPIDMTINVEDPKGFLQGNASAAAQVKSALELALTKFHETNGLPITYWQADVVTMFAGAPTLADDNQAFAMDTALLRLMKSEIPFFATVRAQTLASFAAPPGQVEIILWLK